MASAASVAVVLAEISGSGPLPTKVEPNHAAPASSTAAGTPISAHLGSPPAGGPGSQSGSGAGAATA